MVINDEAHHCYRHKVEAEDEKLTCDDRKEAQQREGEARAGNWSGYHFPLSFKGRGKKKKEGLPPLLNAPI